MRTTRAFAQVDVFTALPYLGNPLAVVLDGAGLSDADMQGFAHWTNLSETTFLLPPSPAALAQGADYRVRIFTPGGELPFAGHPTLGSCHAWLEAGGQPRAPGFVVQECQAGLIRIQRQPMGAAAGESGGRMRLAFGAPPLKRSNPSPTLLAQVAAALGLKPAHIISAQMLDNGPQWLGILLDSVQTVLQVQPNHNALKDLGTKVGLVAVDSAGAAPVLIARSSREARAFTGSATPAHADAEEPSLEVRAFAAPIGVNEDPVTGSLNASLAQWLIADGYAPSDYIAAQGSCIGREGRVHIHQDASGQVWVGGDVVTCIRGEVTL